MANSIQYPVASPEDPLVLTGDLNIDPRHVLYRRRPDQAAWRELASDWADLGRHGGPTALLRRRLDHVLLRSSASAAAQSTVLRGCRVPLGDHDPILAEILLAPSAAVRLPRAAAASLPDGGTA